MNSGEIQGETVIPNNTGGEGAADEAKVETVPKTQFDELQKERDSLAGTIGGLKRELKDLKKSQDSSSQNKKPDEELLKKIDTLTLRTAGISEKDEIDLALKWKERTGMELDEILGDEIFQAKLQALRDDKANQKATSGIEGGGGTGQAKNTPEYWAAKGVPPTPEQVPDKKTRAAIIRAMMKTAGTSGKTFYND